MDCGYDTGHMELIPENEYRAMLLEEEQTALPFESQGENGNNPEEKPIAPTAMVDTSVIASIVVTNGNTGEKITITGEDTNSQEYYNYQYLLKLYSQLDFTAECAENARVGYQYSMKLQDAEGNEVMKYFDAEITDSTSIYLQNMIEEALDDFGDTLEMNQKVAVLVQAIRKLL